MNQPAGGRKPRGYPLTEEMTTEELVAKIERLDPKLSNQEVELDEAPFSAALK